MFVATSFEDYISAKHVMSQFFSTSRQSIWLDNFLSQVQHLLELINV